MSRHEVIHEMPIKAGLALVEAIRARRDLDDGNGYVDRAARKAANEMKSWIEKHYEVV